VKTVRVVADQVDAHRVQVAAIKVRRVVVSRVRRVALAPVVRVVRRVGHTVEVVTTSHLHRIAMIVQHVVLVAVPAAAIAVVRVGRTPISHVLSRRAPVARVRTTLARRVLPTSLTVRAVLRAQLALVTQATRPNSAAGMCPTEWTLVRVRRDRAAIRILRVRAQAVRASRAVRVASVGKALRAALVRMPARMSSARFRLVRAVIAHAASVHREGCHVVRMQGLVVTVRVGRVLAAIVRSIKRVDLAVRRRMRVRMARVPTVPTHRVVRVDRVMKDCRATRIERPSSHSPSVQEPGRRNQSNIAMNQTALPDAVAAQLDRIEAEMRASGLWQSEPLRPEQFDFHTAFAMDTMVFQQWLQFVFIPRVRDAVASNSFPTSSSVGAQAVREFDTVPQANELVSLLSDFDALIEDRRD